MAKKICIMASGSPGYQLTRIVLEAGYKPEMLFIWDKDDKEWIPEFINLAKEHQIPYQQKSSSKDPNFKKILEQINPDLVLLLWWEEIIPKNIIAIPKEGFINIHPSLLPYNRGKHPYYWCIIDGTPHGVTIHKINDKIDSGSILFQQEIPLNIEDTGESIYAKTLGAAFNLFKNSLQPLLLKELSPLFNDKEQSKIHYKKELNPHSCIDLDQSYRAIDLINRIRARTFWNGDSAFFYLNGEKYFVRLEITKAK